MTAPAADNARRSLAPVTPESFASETFTTSTALSRGFVPANTYSMHWIVDARFRDAIGDYLRREGEHVDRYAREIEEHVPYRDSRRDARSK